MNRIERVLERIENDSRYTDGNVDVQETEDGCLAYDPANPSAWLESDTVECNNE